MIPYVNSSFGIRILTRVHGSALYKSLLPALISTIIYIAIVFTFDESHLEELFLHPYPMQALVTAFTFLLVFRANYSYNRWWEAYSAVYLMHSKFLDLATEIAAFHYQSRRYDEYKPPSFGANPGVQSLETRASEILEFHNNTSLNISSQDDLVPINSPSVGGNVVGMTAAQSGEGNMPTPPASPIKRSPHSPMKQSSLNVTPNARTRHAKQQTLTDLMDQMDACEAKEMEMNRQSQMAERSKETENHEDVAAHDRSVESDDMFAVSDFDVSENNFDQIDSERGEGRTEASGRKKQSWLSKMRDRRSNAKAERMAKKLEKHRRRADALPIHLDSAATISRESGDVNLSRKQYKKLKEKQRLRRRRSRHQPATDRLFNQQKAIARSKESSILREELEYRDQFDAKTGKAYSTFTAVSRKHLRDGNLDPDEVPPMLFLEECAHLLSLMSAVAFSTLRNDLPEAESPLTVFEPGLPWPLVDPDGYKGRVRKGWTESKSRFYSVIQFTLGRSRNDHARTLYNAARPFRVIGNVSDAEIEKLQEARGPLAKVSLISMWLLELVSREYQAGSTGDVAAPIISRLYQFVSEGLAGYNQARKIAYIPFPFPHAQITTLYLLVIDFFVTPLLMTTFVTNTTLGCFLNLFSVLCFTGLHEVAREIENPFQNVPNDVPLNNYQAQFNEGLMVMFYGYHPDAYWEKQKNNNDFSGNIPTSTDTSLQIPPNDDLNINQPVACSNRDNLSSDWGKASKEEFEMRSNTANGRDMNRSPNANSSISSHPTSDMPTDDFLRGMMGMNPPMEANHQKEEFEMRSNTTNSEGMNRGSDGNRSVGDRPTSDMPSDDFLRALVGNRLDESIDSFRKVPSEGDSIRLVSDGSMGPPSNHVMFRIPNRTNDVSMGIQLPPDASNPSVVLTNESVEEKDIDDRSRRSD